MKNAIFIDSDYLHRVTQRLDLPHIDFEVFRKSLEDFFQEGPIKFFFYVCSKYTGSEHNGSKRLVDWLSFNGFIVRTKMIDESYFEAESRAFITSSLCVDAMTIAGENMNLIFCLKNAEYVPLLEHLRQKNYTILLQSNKVSANPAIRQSVDKVLDIEKFLDLKE